MMPCLEDLDTTVLSVILSFLAVIVGVLLFILHNILEQSSCLSLSTAGIRHKPPYLSSSLSSSAFMHQISILHWFEIINLDDGPQ